MAFNFNSFLTGLGQGGISGFEQPVNVGGLASLLGVAPAAQASPAPAPADITVTGQAPQQTVSTNINTQAGPLSPMQATPQQVQGLQALEGLPQHKGLFGVKGTLRDILGTLGDAFLVQSGNKAVYAPQRQQERVSDAMVGFTETGKGGLDAIQRVAQINPALAQEMYDKYLTDQNRRDTIEIQRGTQERQTAKDDRARRKEGGQLYAQALAGMKEGNYDPEVLTAIADEYGLPAAYDPPPAYDERLAQRLIAAGTPRSTQVSEQMGNRRQNEVERANPVRERIAQQNADASTARANRPPAGRAAPNPTNASLAAPLLRRVEQGLPLTPGQQETLTRLGFPADRGSGRRRSRPRPGTTPAAATQPGPRRSVGGYSVERLD